jgi:hypothetical protein
VKTVVLTRLAISPHMDRDLTVHSEESRNTKFLDSNWLDERLRLFQEFALRSMSGQTVNPDCWLIAIDARIARRARSSGLQIPEFAKWVALAPDELFSEAIRRELADFGGDILTIRLDSDDAVDPTFISFAQRFSRPNRGINFPHGAQYFVDKSIAIHRWIGSNPTVGFRALNTDMHVHDFGNHPNVSRTVRMVTVATLRPMFLKSSHRANNMAFQPNGIPILFSSRLFRRYGIQGVNLSTPLESKLSIVFSHMGWRLNRLAPSLAKKIQRLRNAREV